MSTANLKDKRVAVLVAEGFEEVELTSPREALEEAGAEVVVLSPAQGTVRSWQRDHWGRPFEVDQPLEGARPEDFDALLLPGGVMNPDHLRGDADAVNFVRHFVAEGKPIAAICHGPWTLIEAGGAEGRTMTSYPSLKTDLQNAGAEWVDREVVVDQGLVTSRAPKDLQAFNRAMIEEIAEGPHRARSA